MKTLCFALLLSLGVAHAGEGQDRGNGGFILECKYPNPAIGLKRYQTLDAYEARVQRKRPLELGNGNSYQQKVQYVLQRLAHIDLHRAQKYQQWFKDMMGPKGEAFFDNVNIPNSEDSGIVISHDGCSERQIVVQRTSVFPGQQRYVFRLDQFNLLDEEEKAILVLHELVYREAIEHRHTNSEATRFFVGEILQADILDRSPIQYQELVNSIRFWTFSYKTFLVERSMEFYPNGEVHALRASDGHYQIEGQKINVYGDVIFTETGVVKYVQKTFNFEFNRPQVKIKLTRPEGLVLDSAGRILKLQRYEEAVFDTEQYHLVLKSGYAIAATLISYDGHPSSEISNKDDDGTIYLREGSWVKVNGEIKYITGRIKLNSSGHFNPGFNLNVVRANGVDMEIADHGIEMEYDSKKNQHQVTVALLKQPVRIKFQGRSFMIKDRIDIDKSINKLKNAVLAEDVEFKNDHSKRKTAKAGTRIMMFTSASSNDDYVIF